MHGAQETITVSGRMVFKVGRSSWTWGLTNDISVHGSVYLDQPWRLRERARTVIVWEGGELVSFMRDLLVMSHLQVGSDLQ